MKLSLKNIFKIVIAVILLAAVAFGVVFLIGINKPGKPNKWNPNLIQTNLPEKTETSNSYGVKNNTTVSFDSSDLYDRNYVSKGLLVVRSSDNYIGFYSLHYNKFLIERQFYSDWLEYSVTSDSTFGYFIKLWYKDVAYLYDSMGNLVYEGENKIDNISVLTPVEETYVVLTLDNDEKLAYEYSANGTVTTYPDPDVILNLNNQDEEFTFEVDDSYVDIQKLDLAEYGKDGYYLSTSNRIYMFFSSDNKLVSSHHVPSNATTIKYFGDSLVYQQVTKMPDDSTDYDFSMDGNKYQLTTTRFNAFNGGTVEKIDAKFVISSSELYKDLDGDHTLLLASILSINSKRVAGEQKVVVLDSGLDVVKELTGFEPKSFIKIGDNYYNTSTEILYNSKLEEISYLGGINPVVNAESEVIVGSISGLYGMLNSNGTVKVPFEYAYINSGIYDNITVGIKEGEHYFLDIASGNAIKVEGTLTKLTNKLYLNRLEESIKLIDYTRQSGISTYLELTDLDTQSIMNNGLNSNSFGNATYYFVEVREKEDSDTTYKYYSFILNNFGKSEMVTVGTELYADVLDGTTFEEATTISESTTPIGLHQTGSGYNLAKFVPTETATYTLKVLSGDDVTINKAYQKINQSDYQNVWLYKDWTDEEEYQNYTFDFEKDQTYYISYHNSTDPYFTFTLTKEDGSNEEVPALIDIAEKETVITSYANSVRFYRLYSDVSITLNITSEGVKVYDYDDYYDEFTYPKSSITLNAGQIKTIVVCGHTREDYDVTFTADLDAYVYGSSDLDCISLVEGDAIRLTNTPATQLTEYRYLTYKNTTASNKIITLYSSNNSYVTYSFEGFGKNANELTEDYTQITVEPNETLYILCDLSYLYTGAYIDIAIISTNELTEGNLGLATYFTPAESGEYNIEFISEYNNIDYVVVDAVELEQCYTNLNGLYELSSDSTYFVMGILPIGLKEDLLESGVELNISKKQGTVAVSSNNSSAGSIETALTVSFNSMGGTEVASQTVTSTTNLVYPEVPTKNGHVFTGWYTEQACSNLYNFNSTITTHLTLYAGWENVTEYDSYDFEIINAHEYTEQANAYETALEEETKIIYTTCLTGGNIRIYYWGSSGYRYSIYNETKQQYIESQSSVSSTYSWFSKYASVNAGDVISITYSQDYGAISPKFRLYFEISLPQSEYGIASNEVTLFDNETVTVTATPNEGYEFLGWYIEDSLYSSETTLTYSPINGDVEIVAKWAEMQAE